MTSTLPEDLDRISSKLESELTSLVNQLRTFQLQFAALDNFDSFERNFIEQAIEEQIQHNIEKQRKIILEQSAVAEFRKVVERLDYRRT